MNQKYLRFIKQPKILAILIFIFFLSVNFLSSAGKTPYDYFSRLAQAFLSCRYWLTENPPWLSELIPAEGGKFYTVYPPMPALILTPFVFIFKEKFEQQYLAHILGALIAVLAFQISLKIKKDTKLAVWSAFLAGAGNIIWFLASVGSAWYLGQVTSCFFLLLAINEILGQKRAFVTGLFIGAAYLSRIHTILSLPFFLFLLNSPQKSFRETLKLGLGILPFFLFNSFYNYLRFGTILDRGYALIPGIFEEPWYQNGLVSLAYIPSHLKIIFLGLPKIKQSFPYLIPSWGGMAIWLTTPAFIFSLAAPFKEKPVRFAWLAIFFIALLVFCHGGTGFSQFGYRYAVDFYPFLIYLTIKGVARKGLKKKHWLLLALSVLVNLWGVIWINKFGWVEF